MPSTPTEAAPAEAVIDDTARQRVVAAAIDCILERGFYRASSNEIARRAGMTWGAIQYYFGTREKLMLAALQRGNDALERRLAEARIEGATSEARVLQLARLLAQQYGAPEYLALLQIVLNLAHNPQTSAETAEALVDIDARVAHRVRELIVAAVDREADDACIRLIFNACRGVAVSHLVTAETTPRQLASRQRLGNLDDDVHGIAKALGLLLDAGQPQA
jgi:AcrR family transcriptional regulator